MEMQASDWKALNEGLVRLYRELDREKHAAVMLDVIHALVPADSIALNIAPIATPYNLSALTRPPKHATAEQLTLLGRYAHQSPFATYYLATMDSNWKMATDFMPLEDFHNTDLHRLALKPLGINHQMFGMLGVLGDTGYAVAINRTHQAFTERERALLNTIHPHLVTSFFNAAVHTRVKQSHEEVCVALEAAPGAYGYFGQDRKLAWLQPKAEAWLQEFFGPESAGSGKVAPAIQALVEQSAAAANAPQQLEVAGRTDTLIACLGASALGGWVLRLDRRPHSTPPHFQPLPNLTTRKNEILKWMVEGKRNEEIALILNLSKRTVEGHVHEILQALHVENRATAIVRAMEYAGAVNRGLTMTPQSRVGFSPPP